jgi:hypothetical protein
VEALRENDVIRKDNERLKREKEGEQKGKEEAMRENEKLIKERGEEQRKKEEALKEIEAVKKDKEELKKEKKKCLKRLERETKAKENTVREVETLKKQLELKVSSTPSSTAVGTSTTEKGVLCIAKWRKRKEGEERSIKGEKSGGSLHSN